MTKKLTEGKRLILAPMAGFTDKIFREICLSMGADFVVTEMVSAKGLVMGSEKTAELLSGAEGKKSIIQLFGHEPEVLSAAAERLLEEYSPYAIDINMGCPMKKIVANGDGSALMRNEKVAADLVFALAGVCHEKDIKVTVKMRAGWSENEKNAPELAKRLEDAGADEITVHGRTREMFYSGKSDPEIIARVKKAVSIPVFANGDVDSKEAAEHLLDLTGADGVAIGRAALGNPFLFREIKSGKEKADAAEKAQTALAHLKREIDEKGEEKAIRAMRAHLAYYIKGIRGAARLRGKITTVSSFEEAKEVMKAVTEAEKDGRI